MGPAARARALSRAARRSACGRARRSRSPSAKRSKATKEAGVDAASLATLDAAGCRRSWRRSKSSPCSVASTIWASTTPRAGGAARRPAARRDPALRRGPSGVERAPRRVDVDDQRRVVGGDGLALARLAVDLRPDRAALQRRGDEQVVDAHAEVLVEVPRPVVPPGVAA